MSTPLEDKLPLIPFKELAGGAFGEPQRLEGHTWGVDCTTVLPNGRLISGSWDKTIKIWDATRTRCLATLGGLLMRGHTSGVKCLIVLPDGRLVSGSHDKTLKIWDVYKQQCLVTLTGHTDIVRCLAVLPDGRLVSGSHDNTLKIWDASEHKFWDVFKEQCLVTLTGHQYPVSCLAVLPDGRLVSGSTDKTIKIWDVDKQQCLVTLTGHTSDVHCLAVLPDGRLVSGSTDKTIKIWDVVSLQCLATLTGHQHPVSCLIALPDGKLASGSYDKTIKIWDVDNQQWRASLQTDEVRSLSILPDGKLVSGGSSSLKIWNLPVLTAELFPASVASVAEPEMEAPKKIVPMAAAKTIEPKMQFKAQSLAQSSPAAATSSAFLALAPASSLSGKFAASYPGPFSGLPRSTPKNLKNYAAGALGEPLTLEAHTSAVNCLIVLPDGRLVSGSNGDDTLNIWDIAQQRCVATMTGDMHGVSCLIVLPDGRLVSGSDDDDTLNIWDIAQHAQQRVPTLTGDMHGVSCLIVLPDGRLASGSYQEVNIWDIDKQQCVATLRGFTGWVDCLAVLPDGRLVSGSYQEIKIWAVASLQCLATLTGHTKRVNCLAVLPDGRLVSGSWDNTLKIWDVAKQQCLTTLSGYADGVTCLIVLPDGRLVSSSWDNTLRVWDVDKQQCLATLTGHTSAVDCLTMFSDGRLISGARDGTLKIWDFPAFAPAFLPAVPAESAVAKPLGVPALLEGSRTQVEKTLLALEQAEALQVQLEEARRKMEALFSSSHSVGSGSATPPTSVSDALTPTSSSSTKSKQPVVDEKGCVPVQFAIPYAALTISSKVLGAGAFGIVYHGEYNFDEVAIKCLHAHKLSETALQEFRDESLTMAGLNHSHIVRFRGACFEEGHYSLVMELMPKGSLHDLLHNKQDIPWTIRAQIAADIASGLAYLHSRGILHRDLKSMNVLLDGALRAKISDFGLALVKVETQSTSQIGAKAMGTTRWMAPELFKRGSKCTPETDMYSFGMVLWELTSRKLPYAEGNDVQAMGWIKDGEKETIPADCPPEMTQVINDCWKTMPAERPCSADTSNTLTAWCRFFQGQAQPTGDSSRTVMRRVEGKVDAILATQLF